MEIIIKDKEVVGLIDEDKLVERLAEHIVNSKSVSYDRTFNKEWLEAIKSAVKELVEIYLEEYGGEFDVRDEIHKQIRAMTKEEIIKVLTGKD